MSVCIGIISYFPKDLILRWKRIERCRELFSSIEKIFPDIPVFLIAQNWDNEIVLSDKITAYYYDKLGVLGARKVLRNKFLLSKFDYMIMLDDDCILSGTKQDGDDLLEQLYNEEGRYLITRDNMLKMCAVSRQVYGKYPLVELSPEAGTGLEDLAYCRLLRMMCPEKEMKYFGKLQEVSNWTKDASISTWDRRDIISLVKKTVDYINSLQN